MKFKLPIPPAATRSLTSAKAPRKIISSINIISYSTLLTALRFIDELNVRRGIVSVRRTYAKLGTIVFDALNIETGKVL